MKYMIILGFIATIPTVSAVISGNSGTHRVFYPQQWVNGLEACISDVTDATLEIFFSYGQKTPTLAAKCFALCVYTKSGLFVDGKFDPTAIGYFLRDHIGFHHLLERTITMFKTAANAGNTELGSDSDKTWAYHSTFGTPKHQKLWKAVFRPFEDSCCCSSSLTSVGNLSTVKQGYPNSSCNHNYDY